MIHDISMKIENGMVSYEGDPPPKIELTSKMPEKHCNLSKFDAGVHTGTHIDAPYHWIENGRKTGSIPLEGYLIGKCVVLDLTGKDECIEAEDLNGSDIPKGGIVLLKTRNSQDPLERFSRKFIYVARSAADYLTGIGINTLGVDYLSVEQFGGPGGHYVHKTLLGNNIVIIEGLRLGGIRPGTYRLVCLPLRIDADGAPARAVLEDI